MKKFMFIFLAIVFFNVSVFSLYYLKIINYYGFKLMNNNFDILLTNLIYVLGLVLYMLIYSKFMINKFNYFKSGLLGIILGIIICFCIQGLLIEEYLFIILYSSFIITFISYSIYFDNVKDKVFK